MAPIPTETLAPSELLKAIFNYIGLKGIHHHHPEYDDIIDLPEDGEPGEPGTGPPRSGIFIVIIVFGFVAVMFTIVAGCIWCVAANEPLRYSERGVRRGPWRTKRMVPFKGWYRRHRNFPRTKSDMSRDTRRSILDSLSTTNWRGRINRRGEPDYSYKQWRRPKDPKFWSEHGHLGPNTQLNPHSPLLFTQNRGQGYNTFSKEVGPEGSQILSLSIPALPDMDQLSTDGPYSPLPSPIPPLRRPPLKGAKGRAVSTPSTLTPAGERGLRLYRPRSYSWSGCSTRGRPWRCAKNDFDGSGRRSSLGNCGRGSPRGINRGGGPSSGLGPTGLDVVEEEALSGTEK